MENIEELLKAYQDNTDCSVDWSNGTGYGDGFGNGTASGGTVQNGYGITYTDKNYGELSGISQFEGNTVYHVDGQSFIVNSMFDGWADISILQSDLTYRKGKLVCENGNLVVKDN